MLDEGQIMIRDTARRFASERLAPSGAAWERAGALPREVLSELGALGFLGMTVDPAWGGAGADYVTYALALTEIAAGDASVSTVMSVQNAPVCAIFERFGTDVQKARWLRPLASGEMIGAFALTEPHAGSDAAAIGTRAVRSSSGWRLDGTKQFISSGRIAGVAIVFAVTDPAAGKRGISAFAVPTDTPGYTVTSVEAKLGQKASDTCALAFDAMEVADDALIGTEGQGYRIALASLEAGRIGIAAQSVGLAQAACAHAKAYAQERTSFGAKLKDHQAVAFRLAEMATRIEAARALTLEAARLKDAGAPALERAAMAKLFASEAAEWVASQAIQVLGGYGYLQDFPVERLYRDAKVCQIYEGTSDIQKLLIARSLFD